MAALLVASVDSVIRSASGPLGLVVVFVFSFLCAVALPFPSELVLLAPVDLGLPRWGDLAVIVGVAAAGKAAGSLLALAVSTSATRTGFFRDAVQRFRVGAVVMVEDAIGTVVTRYGALGLAAVLAVPGSPDTAAIYAFSVGNDDYVEFAAAVFAGSVARLLVVLGFAGVVLTLLPSGLL